MYELKKILLYINTIKYLKFTQIWHQLWNRLSGTRRKKLMNQVMKLHANHVVPIKILIPKLDFDHVYLLRFRVEELMNNEVEILHEKHVIDLTRWEAASASHLWNYNLHYLEFLIPLAVASQDDKTEQYFNKWCEYVKSWMEYPAGDSFEPYTISMRIPNLLICMNVLQDKIKGTELEERLLNSIYQQYRYLLATRELALLANHYFENLKTILICSVLFGEEENYRKYFHRFCKQIKEQILPDGLHYERSIMYHKIILEDILRVYIALDNRDDSEKLVPVIENMAEALASVSKGFHKTPLFNDAGNNVAKDTDSLLRAVQDVIGYRATTGRTAFETSGYYKLYTGENVLMFDCGQIGPSYMGGHSHCDCLSFELVRRDKPLFINSGTYQYQGKLRRFFRSTMAHNTIMIDEREQAELWGEHRAARRLSKINCESKDQCLLGKFKSFHGDSFIRKMELMENRVEITDCVIAGDWKKHYARQFFHIASGYSFIIDSERKISVWDDSKKLAVINISAESKWRIHRKGYICSLAQDFGELERKEVLEIRTPFIKRIQMQVVLDLL